MAATFTRDGVPISAPVFTDTQREQMAQAIASAMIRLARSDIEAAVADYLRREKNVS